MRRIVVVPTRLRYFFLLVLLSTLVVVITPADAQTLLRTLDTPNPQYMANFGSSVAVGDVNGDGKGDLAVGAPFEDVGGSQDQGQAYVFSGANGSLLLTLDTPNPRASGNFGSSVAVGDVNGEGKGDIAVGAPWEDVGGRVYVFSGADGSLLRTLNTPNPRWGGAVFGSCVAVVDVNGDGKKDIAVGSSSEFVGGIPSGRAYVFSGADGSVLLTLDTPNPQAYAYFGSSVAAGDVNGDGRPDIAVAAASENVGGNIGQGRAYVFSGPSGSLLLTLNIPNPQAEDYFGLSLAVGDVDGDGNADIAVGAPYEYVGVSANEGRAYVFSGASGSLLFTLDSPNPQAGSQFGVSLAMGDVIGDGKGDITVGARYEKVNGNTSQGRAYIFSGVDGSVLLTLNTPNPQVQAGFGSSLAVGDVTDDGKDDIAVGSPHEDVGGIEFQGRAYVFSAPVPTPTPRPGVGGAVKLPPAAIAAESGTQADGSGWATGAYAALIAAVVAMGTGVWYARRRWLR